MNDGEPTLAGSTKSVGDRVEIRIRDNGTGRWRSLDPTAGQVDVFPQEITRALLNLANTA